MGFKKWQKSETVKRQIGGVGGGRWKVANYRLQIARERIRLLLSPLRFFEGGRRFWGLQFLPNYD